MMSKWTEIRDGALEAIKEGAVDVVEETKQEFLANFLEAGVPVVEAYAEQFKAAVKEQAKTETGWCKIRDAYVIPMAISLSLYVGKKILSAVAGKTQSVAVA